MGRSLRDRGIALLLAAAAAGAHAGCRCACGGDDLVARVVSLSRSTDVSTRGAAFAAAETGQELRVGDALRTDRTGRATVDVLGQGEITIAPGSLVRFAELSGTGAERELRLVFETGSLDLSMTDAEDAPLLVIDGPGGRVRLHRGGRARLVLDEAQRLRLDVELGLAELLPTEGAPSTVSAGGSAVVGGAAPRDGGAEEEADAAAEDGSIAISPTELDEPDGGVATGVEVQLGRGARVELQAPGADGFEAARGRSLTLEPGTTVRVTGRDGVVVQGPDGAAVELRTGAVATIGGARGGRLEVALRGGGAEARSTGEGVAALTVPGGQAATARLGARAAFVATVMDRERTRVSVRDGAAFVRSGDRTERVLTGMEAILGPAGELSVTAGGEVHPVLQGGSAVLHDPQSRGGFTIRWSPIEGCSTYVVQVSHRGRPLVEAVTARPGLPLSDLEYGSFEWRAACIHDGRPNWTVQRDGRILRQPDRSGNVVLPTKAPSNTLESDGRRYTVMYQNRLPALTLRWAGAPAASSYTLEVFNDGTGARVHRGTTAKASVGFRSGFFAEGSYYWFFRAEGGAKRESSPVTRAAITFDNQAPAIQILEPNDGAAASGSVRVRGLAAVGSTVSVNGVDLALGGDFRFDQVVPVGPGNLIVFRVSTPRRGVGYYLRHLSR